MCGCLATVNSLCSATFSFFPSLSLAVFTHWQRDGNQSSYACRNEKIGCSLMLTHTHTHTPLHKKSTKHWVHTMNTHCYYTHHVVTKGLRVCVSVCVRLCVQSDSDKVSTGCDLLSAGWPERQTEWHLWGHHCRNNRRKGTKGQICLLSPRDCSRERTNTVRVRFWLHCRSQMSPQG